MSLTRVSRSLCVRTLPRSHRAFASSALANTPARTSLYAFHTDREHGGKMVEFAGYSMPLVYDATPGTKVAGGAVAEHHQVRNAAGLFDVGHMVQSTFQGPGATAFLSHLLPASLETLSYESTFRSSLSVLLNEQGGIIDDCMITRWGKDAFYLVTNAGRKTEDLAWIQKQLDAWEGDKVDWEVLGNGLIALQGPESEASLSALLPPAATTSLKNLKFGNSIHTTLSTLPGSPLVHIARGGYTGEDGFEISVTEKSGQGETEGVARALLDQPSVKLAGLAARDSLRLEAGLCLYGHDLDETVGIGEAALGWVVGKDRRTPGSFIGSERTLKELQKGLVGIERKRVGLTVEKGAPAREGAKIFALDGATQIGIVTSGLPSPSTKSNIAMAYVSTKAGGAHKKGAEVLIEVRGKMRKATVGGMPWIEVGYVR